MKYIYKQTKVVSKQQLYQMSSMDVQWGYDIYIQWHYHAFSMGVQQLDYSCTMYILNRHWIINI
jgi:hypothetical protein